MVSVSPDTSLGFGGVFAVIAIYINGGAAAAAEFATTLAVAFGVLGVMAAWQPILSDALDHLRSRTEVTD